MHNLDQAVGVTEVSIVWDEINTAGATCMQFSGRFAEASGSSNPYNFTDFVLLEYVLGLATTWTPLLDFRGSPSGLRLQSDPSVLLTRTAQEVTATIPNTDRKTALRLRLRASLDSAGKDAAMTAFMLFYSVDPNACGRTSKYCFSPKDCSFRGVCDFGGECECWEGFQGPDCSDRVGTGTAEACSLDRRFLCASGTCEQFNDCSVCPLNKPGYCKPFPDLLCQQVRELDL